MAARPKTLIKKSSVAGHIIVRLPDGNFHFVKTPKQALARHTAWCKTAVKGKHHLVSIIEWEGFDASELPNQEQGK